MKRRIKTLLIKLFSLIKRFPAKSTEPVDIRRLIKTVRPLSTNHKLVRVGPESDGGYLVPDDLEGIQACFSPGVAFVSGFEKQCAEMGMKVFMADASVDSPSEQHASFNFQKKFISAITQDEFITLDNWVRTSLPETESDLLLQIDIEGAEYEAFLSASEKLMNRFRIIVAEFHQLDELWNDAFCRLVRPAFDKILQTHACVHAHPNNCCGSLTKSGIEIPRVMEFTFHRWDRIECCTSQTIFPDPLDCDNTGKPTLALPPIWYHS